MIDFLIREPIIQSTQNFIDRLKPKVNVRLHKELPLPSASAIRKMSVMVAQINALEDGIQPLSDEALKAKTADFRQKYSQGTQEVRARLTQLQETYRKALSREEKEDLSGELQSVRQEFKKLKAAILLEILPEAFAVVREVGRRTLSMRHFDVQLIGGMALHQGKIAEMSTGEGKTLVATLPAYLNALTGEGVHVITVNDYLARRDRTWMGPIYEFLGLTVGVIQHDMNNEQRRAAYACDITYGTNNEFGFDYLRDNMVNFKEEMVQRGHAFAIVDEVDSILIDEARTPLIISGPAEESTDKYYKAHEISRKLAGRRVTEQEEVDAKYRGDDLSKGYDYLADEKSRAISLTEEGEEKAAKLFGVENLHEMDTVEYRHHVLQSLKAKEFFRRDVDYVVRDGKVVIVDEFTGRMMPGRRWSDGLHQAVEAREGIRIERENQTLATITFQNYFRMYAKLSGMTGTAITEATEFKEIYDLDCVSIPTNRLLIRKNYPDAIYKTEREKFNAVVEEIFGLHQKGQPVLVGTISIEKSERLALLLKQRGIAHQVLNAKYHDREAHIIAQAGHFKGVTIATNMAGRGTDIVLGGNAEHLAASLMEDKKKESPEALPEESFQKFLAQFKEQVKKEHEQVVSLGGLHVLGTERHESRRIDNQLRGRCGRQGDPGSSRFYVSLEDDLMRLFGSDRIMAIMTHLGMEENQAIEHPLVSRAIEVAQKRVETHNFEIRKQLLDYDNVMNKQREVVYSLRRSILDEEDTREMIVDALKDALARFLEQQLTSSPEEEASGDLLLANLKALSGVDLSVLKTQLESTPKAEWGGMLEAEILKFYETKERDLSVEHMRQLERFVLLQTIDSRWKDHLYAMDQLKEGIGLRALGQRDPKMEYQKEGFRMFQEMYASIHDEVAWTVLRMRLVSEQPRPRSVFSSLPQQFVHSEFSSLGSEAASPQMPAVSSPSPVTSSTPVTHHGEAKIGRNDPCPCGSGKKYKKCCGQ